jgi:hypothetical protein
VALLAKVGQHGTGPVDVAEEVGLQHLPEGLGRGCLQRAEQVDAGVVDPDVDAAEPLDGTSGQLGHCCLVGHVGGHGQGLAARRLTVPRQRFQGTGPSRGQHHPRPPVSEGESGRPADPTGGTGDHDHRTIELPAHAEHPPP